MKRLTFLLVAAVLPLGNVRAEDLLQNNDFSSGIDGWSGDIKSAADIAGTDPNIPLGSKGIVVQLKPDAFTRAAVDFNFYCRWGRISMEYSRVNDTQFSTSDDEAKAALPSLGESSLTYTKAGQGFFMFLSKDGTSKANIIPFRLPAADSTTKETAVHLVGCDPYPDKKTLVLAFPPGKGEVIITNVSIKANALGTRGGAPIEPPPRADSQANTSGSSEAQAFLENADFSDGTVHWRGDGKPAGADATNDFVSNSRVSKGITVEMRSNNWTKVTQELKRPPGAYATVTVEHQASSDYLPTDHDDAYGNIGTRLEFEGADIESQKGATTVLLDTAPKMRAFTAASGATTVYLDHVTAKSFVLAGDGQTHTVTVPLPGPQAATTMTTTFCLAFPPGKGTVTITKISLTAR